MTNLINISENLTRIFSLSCLMLRLTLFGLFHLSYEPFDFNCHSSFDICQETFPVLPCVFQRSNISKYAQNKQKYCLFHIGSFLCCLGRMRFLGTIVAYFLVTF